MIRKAILLLLVLLSVITCDWSESGNELEHYPFEIRFDTQKDEMGQAFLSFTIDLDSGKYYVSPHSGGFHQRLIFSLEETDSLFLLGDLVEYPKTYNDYDSLSDKEGRFVREKTTFLQRMTVSSQNNFKVSGLIWLGMLPGEQPFEINFILSQQSGKLEIENIKRKVSDYPSFWDNKRLDTPKDSLSYIKF